MQKLVFKLRRNITTTQLKNAVCTDNMRPAMKGAFVNSEFSEMVCTDGHILIQYPIEIIEGSGSGIVPIELFNPKIFFGYNKSKITEFTFVIEDKCCSVFFGNKFIIKVPLIDCNYPNYKSVLLNPEDTCGLEEIGINLKIIERFKKATFEKGFNQGYKFQFYGKNRGISVEETSQPFPIKGIIMPYMYE